MSRTNYGNEAIAALMERGNLFQVLAGAWLLWAWSFREEWRKR